MATEQDTLTEAEKIFRLLGRCGHKMEGWDGSMLKCDLLIGHEDLHRQKDKCGEWTWDG